jgi:hypothetical protein
VKTLALAVTLTFASLATGCSKKSSEASAPPVAAAAPSVAALAPSVAPAPSDSIAPLASAVPSVPTEEQYEQKAQTAISSTAAAETELKKLEQEIGQ